MLARKSFGTHTRRSGRYRHESAPNSDEPIIGARCPRRGSENSCLPIADASEGTFAGGRSTSLAWTIDLRPCILPELICDIGALTDWIVKLSKHDQC